MARTATAAKKVTSDSNASTASTDGTNTTTTTKPSWSVLETFQERFYTSAYFGLRDVWGKTCRAYLKEQFDWQEFNEAFSLVFGEVDEKRFSAVDLHDTAIHFFYLTFKDLVKRNLDNLKNRKKYNSQPKNQSQNSAADYDEQF